MQPTKLGTGYIPSPPDYRDRIAASLSPLATAPIALAETFDTDLSALGPVMMQAQEPACVSHSVALLLKLYWYRKTGKVIDFSPRFLDTLAKRYDGLGDPTDRAVQGTYPRLVFWLAVNFGCATQATVPNDTSLPVLQYRADAILTPAAMAEAAQYKIPGFVHVPNDLYSTRSATQIWGALSVGKYIGLEWWTSPAGVTSWAKKDLEPARDGVLTPKVIDSGHQTVMRGWTTAVLNRGRNSWSEAWDDDGDYDFDGTKWAAFIQEAWAVAELPQDLVTFLKILPSPNNFFYQWNQDMQFGQKSEPIAMAQVAFMILGYLQPIAPSEFGIFGPKTAGANLAFQLANKITPTAADSIGPKTCLALNKRFAVTSS